MHRARIVKSIELKVIEAKDLQKAGNVILYGLKTICSTSVACLAVTVIVVLLAITILSVYLYFLRFMH